MSYVQFISNVQFFVHFHTNDIYLHSRWTEFIAKFSNQRCQKLRSIVFELKENAVHLLYASLQIRPAYNLS